ncbi:NADP-dependent oxidoreductase [Cryomorphaceae bacterium]|nr:NADP-dependent oxidoreductase [Cryomorphaceae bacterium]
MKAIIRTKPGKEFTTMKVLDIDMPKLSSGHLRIRMISSRVNPVDMDLMKGFPGLKYKDPQLGGVDGSGEIIEIAPDVSEFSLGDKVMFYRLFTDIGTWGEEITIPANHCALIPDHIDAKNAGGVALPLLTAYEALKSLSPKPGASILIHGAGGGVGFQAVLLAKSMGLRIIANASERDRKDLEELGTEQFIDYKKVNFEEVLHGNPPDYIFDVLGGQTLRKSILLQSNKVVSTSFPDVQNMHKTGVKLPGPLKWLMKLMNRKYERLASKLGVQLIGQVTGANGSGLQRAIVTLGEDYFARPQREISLEEIEVKGLSKSDLGKTIVF